MTWQDEQARILQGLKQTLCKPLLEEMEMKNKELQIQQVQIQQQQLMMQFQQNREKTLMAMNHSNNVYQAKVEKIYSDERISESDKKHEIEKLKLAYQEEEKKHRRELETLELKSNLEIKKMEAKAGIERTTAQQKREPKRVDRYIRENRDQHYMIIGASGSGKSEVFKTIINDRLNRHKTTIIIDPKTVIDKPIESMPDFNGYCVKLKLGANEVFNPFDISEQATEMEVEARLKSITHALQSLFGLSDPQYLLLKSVCKEALTDINGSFGTVIKNIESRTDDNKAISRALLVALEPLNSIGVRELTSGKNTVDIPKMLNSNKPSLISIMKETDKGALSSIIIGMLATETMINPVDDTLLIIDECHDVLSETFEKVLIQTRSMGLTAILATALFRGIKTQALKDAILDNCSPYIKTTKDEGVFSLSIGDRKLSINKELLSLNPKNETEQPKSVEVESDEDEPDFLKTLGWR